MSHWFKPKSKGYGAYPANWKGWAALVAFLAFGIAISIAFYKMRDGLDWVTIALWLGVWTILDFLFIYIAWKKTDGSWRWRSGNESQEEKNAGN